jgi:tetratricopeptide (TPR) repeat protein
VVEQAAAREKLLRTGLVKVARKVHAYEATLRETEARRLASEAVTNVVIVGSRPSPSPRAREPAVLDTARQHVAAGRYREAEKLYLTGLQRDPTNAQLHYNLGVLYDDYLQKPREAARYYRKYLSLNPAAADAGIVRSWLPELDAQSR